MTKDDAHAHPGNREMQYGEAWREARDLLRPQPILDTEHFREFTPFGPGWTLKATHGRTTYGPHTFTVPVVGVVTEVYPGSDLGVRLSFVIALGAQLWAVDPDGPWRLEAQK